MQEMNVPSYSNSDDSVEVSSMASSSFGDSVGGLSRRYNTAIAKRMRQRRMRKMKERDSASSTFAEHSKQQLRTPPRINKQTSSKIFPIAESTTPPSRSQDNYVPMNIEIKKKKSSVTSNSFPNLQTAPSKEDNIQDTVNCKVNCALASDEAQAIEEKNFPEDKFSDLFQENDTTDAFLTPKRQNNVHLTSSEDNGHESYDNPADAQVYSPRGVSSPSAPGSLSHHDIPRTPRGRELFYRGDLDEDVRQSMLFEVLRKQMVDPSSELEELLKQIDRDFFKPIDRSFATRRMNACGALKIMAAKEENRLKICWSKGVLAAVASVLKDVNEIVQDEQTRAATVLARNRIVSALLSLVLNKKNRLLIVSTPGLLESIAQVIVHDEGEARQGCCTVLFYLSKTAETRLTIAKNRGLMVALTKVIEVPTWIVPQQPQIPDVCKSKIDLHTLDTHSTHDEMSCTSSEYSHTSDSKKDFDGEEEANERQKYVLFNLSYESYVDTSEPVEIDYDLDPNHFLHGSRLMVFASLLCLVKNKETAAFVGLQDTIVEAMIGVSRKFSSPSHVSALTILAHLTRHPQNCMLEYLPFLPLLQEAATSSPDTEGRRYALCALQNLSVDSSCRAPVAHAPGILECLTNRLKASESKGELIAAIATLQNLADEPENLIQFTTVENCVAAIIEVAQSDENTEKEMDLSSYLAKNTLATLSHWLRRSATDSGGTDRQILQSATLQPLTYEGFS